MTVSRFPIIYFSVGEISAETSWKGLGSDPIVVLTQRGSITPVDTNVSLDPVTDDPEWAEWSIAKLEKAALKGPLCINDVVYAELSVRYDRI